MIECICKLTWNVLFTYNNKKLPFILWTNQDYGSLKHITLLKSYWLHKCPMHNTLGDIVRRVWKLVWFYMTLTPQVTIELKISFKKKISWLSLDES